jgi:hypothetical protein
VSRNRRLIARVEESSKSSCTSTRNDQTFKKVIRSNMTKRGFLFRCKDGYLEVTVEQANTMKSKCEYFFNVFAHDTTETKDFVLHKPDWTLGTAKALVEVMITGKVNLRDYPACIRFLEAADQVLLLEDIRPLLPPVVKHHTGYDDQTQDAGIAFMLRFMESDFGNFQNSFVLHTSKKMAASTWVSLLHDNIWLGPFEDGIAVKLCQDGGQQHGQQDDVRKRPVCSLLSQLGRISYDVSGFSIESLQVKGEAESIGEALRVKTKEESMGVALALQHICTALRRDIPPSTAYDNRKIYFSRQEFSLRIPVSFLGVMKETIELITKETGARGYMHNKSHLGYYPSCHNGGRRPCPTFFGSFQELNDTLRLFPESEIAKDDKGNTRCALRVCAPNGTNLLRVIAATQHCQENPRTLGVDVEANAYFVVKTVHDMKIMLSYLAGKQTPASTPEQPIEVFDLATYFRAA